MLFARIFAIVHGHGVEPERIRIRFLISVEAAADLREYALFASADTASCYTFLQQGTSFFDDWQFITGGDLTNGLVTYIDENTAVRD